MRPLMRMNRQMVLRMMDIALRYCQIGWALARGYLVVEDIVRDGKNRVKSKGNKLR